MSEIERLRREKSALMVRVREIEEEIERLKEAETE